MIFEDRLGVKPYSHEIMGDLEEYLRQCETGMVDNLFYGSKYFFEIRDKKLMIPKVTCVRIDRSPASDIGYFVNSDYLLESNGYGPQNMSLMGAEKGIYDPNKVLKKKAWSIYGMSMKLFGLSDTSE